MERSFHEKSLWLMFVGLIAAFGLYFYLALATVLPTPAAIDVMPHQMALFAVAVILLVIAQIAGHIIIAVIAVINRRAERLSETDERDRLIELKGTRNAAYVLATGVFLSLSAAMVTDGNFVFTHVLLAFWVLAQLVEIGSQLVLYRRGR